jgi:hypothetical protein
VRRLAQVSTAGGNPKEKVRKPFFFEKKKQKTFDFGVRRLAQRRDQKIKVFWFFFSKKNCFPVVFLRHSYPWVNVYAYTRPLPPT